MSPHLYKYEGFTARSLQNLKSQILYFGSPLNFNDPYDCAVTPNFAQPTDQEIEAIRTAYLNDEATPPLPRRQFTELTTEQLREVLLRAGASALGKSIADFLATRGVACFSERRDDLLMWAHYGGRYQGFCLEFDTSAEPFSKIRQVRYAEKPPQLSLKSVLLERDFDPVADLFCTKSEAWS
jgi:hypothetical protein